MPAGFCAELTSNVLLTSSLQEVLRLVRQLVQLQLVLQLLPFYLLPALKRWRWSDCPGHHERLL
jgi:hypothetical protein